VVSQGAAAAPSLLRARGRLAIRWEMRRRDTEGTEACLTSRAAAQTLLLVVLN